MPMIEIFLALMLGFFVGFWNVDVNEYGQEQIYGSGNQTIDKYGNTAEDLVRLEALKKAAAPAPEVSK
tara:strand:+ start:256 stop:459 length:204 start_codon:yes stop_codon:yes gene_type:complete